VDDTVAAVEFALAARTIVVLFPVARATAYPLVASDNATSAAKIGDLRRPDGGSADGGLAEGAAGGIGGGVDDWYASSAAASDHVGAGAVGIDSGA